MQKKKIFISAVLFLLLGFLLVQKQNLITTFEVDGPSMLPNFHNGEQVILNKLAYTYADPKYGDVIIFKSPEKQGIYLIKRIIGLPGDTIEVHGGQVFRNAVPLRETYVLEPMLDYFETVHVPTGSVFVMGDNRNISLDSRNSHIGPVPQSLILGRVDFNYQMNGALLALEPTPLLQPIEDLPNH